MSQLKVFVLPGDGIGPEVTEAAVEVLRVISNSTDLSFSMEYGLFGGAAIDDCGKPLSAATLEMAMSADAVLLGAVGGPRWDALPAPKRPEKGLLGLRSALSVYANLRPIRSFAALVHASPLKSPSAFPIDLVIVRELLGDVYFGEPRGVSGEIGKRRGINTMSYTEQEIRRIAERAFSLARSRKGKLLSVDKANVLEVMGLWRAIVEEVHGSYPEVELSHMYVDNCAMQLILDPRRFDVLVTGNLFGDILSDEAAALTGSIGLMPSASLGEQHALYEPVHGSAPDIAGKGIANPLAAILSVALLLRHTATRPDLADLVERAVERALDLGLRTPDLLADSGLCALTTVSTRQMTQGVVRELLGLLDEEDQRT